MQGLQDLLLAQPFLGRSEIPGQDREDGDRAKDDAGEVERFGIHGEEKGRDHNLKETPSIAEPS